MKSSKPIMNVEKEKNTFVKSVSGIVSPFNPISIIVSIAVPYSINRIKSVVVTDSRIASK